MHGSMKLNLAAGRQPAVRGEARRYRAWRLIDQSDAGIQHPHDRGAAHHGASVPSGRDAMSASGSIGALSFQSRW
jgi:hypothetical protein